MVAATDNVVVVTRDAGRGWNNKSPLLNSRFRFGSSFSGYGYSRYGGVCFSPNIIVTESAVIFHFRSYKTHRPAERPLMTTRSACG